MLCRQELDDPRRCIAEGKAVTNCALNFFRKVKNSCHEEFQQYATCLDKSSSDYQYNKYASASSASPGGNGEMMRIDLDFAIPYIQSLYPFRRCRTTQGVYDKCMNDNMGIQRPDYGYFCRAKVHDSPRPAPEKPKKTVYADATPGLPDDFPREPARYGSRFHWLN